VLDGEAVERGQLTGFVNSNFDRFLNQLFAGTGTTRRDVTNALEDRPAFVWVADENLASTAMQGMRAATAPLPSARQVGGELAEVRSSSDLDAWHEVYCEVFGGDPRGREDWRRVNEALGPGGEGSLVLLVARLDGVPAATGGVFFDQGWAGLYCFTTREAMRGRGFCTALVTASHAAAAARGIGRALLHATAQGAPVYAAAGYERRRPLPLLVV